MSRLRELIEQYCPDGVEYKALGEVGTLTKGKGLQKKDFTESGVGCIHYGQIYTRLSVKTTEVLTYVSEESAKKFTAVMPGDLVIAITSENVDDVCKSVVWMGDEPIVTGAHAAVFYHGLDPMYVGYLFQTYDINRQKVTMVDGVKVIEMKVEQLEKLRIPVPPIEVQREIVRILDSMQELDDALSEEYSERIVQSNIVMKQLLVEKPRTMSKLTDIAKVCDADRKPIKQANRIPGPYPYYGASGIVDYVHDYIFDGDYLLVSEDGANLVSRTQPIAFSISGKTWVNNHAHILKFDDYRQQQVVEHYLNSIDLTPFLGIAAQPKLTQANLKELEVPLLNDDELDTITPIIDSTVMLIDAINEELQARRKQFEYYRDKLLDFPEKVA